MSRAEVDATFGRGSWRPLPRHVICQGDKWRPIDDGKSSGHNSVVTMSETIVCQSNELHAIVCRRLAQSMDSLLSQKGLPPTWPSWLQPCAGLDDMWKGYRQDHTRAAQQGLCVVTVAHPGTRSMVYSICDGLHFGLAAAVVQLNRHPMLYTAFLRRTMCLLAAHYFDDKQHCCRSPKVGCYL